MCPVCTVAVGAGLGLSRWLGVDDLISGIWIGGLIVSLIGITLKWLAKKGYPSLALKILVVFLFYFLTIGPLYWTKIIGYPCSHIWGLDNLVLGIIVGSVVFLISHLFHLWLKKKNQGKAYFPFQKVVIPVIFLLITSLIFYFSVCR